MIRTARALLADLFRLLRLALRSRAQLAAENLFLRKQLAYYVERNVRPKRADNATRVTLVLLSRFVAWRDLLTIVRPDTLVRWHRDLYRLVWRAKSRPRGRPRIPLELQRLIADMATANRTWGEERIAAELRLKLGLTVSSRTVRRYMPQRPRQRGGQSTQPWATFLHGDRPPRTVRLPRRCECKTRWATTTITAWNASLHEFLRSTRPINSLSTP